MTPDDIDRVFGQGRLKMATGAHVEVVRERALSGSERRYTKRFLAGASGDFRRWTEREWQVLERLGRHAAAPVAKALDFLPADDGAPDALQTRDAGATVDQWASAVPLRRGETALRSVFEDCAHWWSLAKQCLLTLDAVHSLGFVHLDFKPDNVCLPWAPAGAGRPVQGQPLVPRFRGLVLIDVAFSLFPEVELVEPLPLLRQPAYEYQSPRLLHALEEGRRGNLAPTLALDWRCDLFSLAAMLWRFLPESAAGAGGDWTEERHAQAGAFVRQLLDVHNDAIPAQWPHRALIGLASLRLREPALEASIQAGRTFDPERAKPLGIEPTPPTRLAEVPKRRPGARRDASSDGAVSAPTPLDDASEGAEGRPSAPAPGPGFETGPPAAAAAAGAGPATATPGAGAAAGALGAGPAAGAPPRRAGPGTALAQAQALEQARARAAAESLATAEAASDDAPAARRADQVRRRARIGKRAAAAVLVLATAGTAGWWFVNDANPRFDDAPSSTPDGRAPTPAASAAVAAASPSPPPSAAATLSPPPAATPSRAVGAASAPLLSSPDASAATGLPGGGADLDAVADALMAERLPRVADAARRELAPVLEAAAEAREFRRRGTVRAAAEAVRSAAARPDLATAVRERDAHTLNEAALVAFGRNDDVADALRLQRRAFAANPLDSEVAGNLAFLHLRQKPPQAEPARQLALHALALNDPRFPIGRIEDWTSLAVASALVGRDTDARNAWFASMALTSDLQRQCDAAVRAQATHGERLRPSVRAMLQRARSSAAYGRCEVAAASEATRTPHRAKPSPPAARSRKVTAPLRRSR